MEGRQNSFHHLERKIWLESKTDLAKFTHLESEVFAECDIRLNEEHLSLITHSQLDLVLNFQVGPSHKIPT